MTNSATHRHTPRRYTRRATTTVATRTTRPHRMGTLYRRAALTASTWSVLLIAGFAAGIWTGR